VSSFSEIVTFALVGNPPASQDKWNLPAHASAPILQSNDIIERKSSWRFSKEPPID
jgi:hypothetical protein